MRPRDRLWLLLPVALCFALYWQGLAAWFTMDDFAWLNMAKRVEAGGSLRDALFLPKAQGTIRVFSERLYFLSIHRVFGAGALAYRAVAFLTLFGAAGLLAWIAWRSTKSRAAAVLAPVFWLVSPGLGTPLSWSSAYNQLLCSLLLLAAFAFWIRYLETGESRWWWWQWLPFLAAFGALELAVVYPVLAAGYALATCPQRWRRSLPMFVPSIAFAAFHFLAVPKTDKLYALHFDAAILTTAKQYLKWAVATSRLPDLYGGPFWAWGSRIATWLLTAALLAYVIRAARSRDRVALFFAGWFVVALAPFLPLRDHRTDYYLAVPAIGLALLLATAVTSLRGRARNAAISAAVLYTAAGATVTSSIVRWRYELAEQSRLIVLGVSRAQQSHPGRIILLKDVTPQQVYGTMPDNSFEYFGSPRVFLAPEEQARLEARPGLGDVAPYVLPAGDARKAVDEYNAVVYSCAGGRLTNVTREWYRHAAADAATVQRFVDVGNPLSARQLGPEWHQIQGRARWMPRKATVRMSGPSKPGQRLYLHGYAAQDQLRGGPVPLRVSVEGTPVGEGRITRWDVPFDFDFALPDALAGKASVLVQLEAGRVFVPPQDGRELGALFGTLSIR